MRFRMLGPLEVRSGEGWVSIGAAKWRSLLACLLLKPGQIVSTDSLIFELWGDNPPPTATNLVSIYVHRLRRSIDDAEGHTIVYRKPGYQLRLADDDTDLRRFESLAADGRQALAAGDPETAAAILKEAEGLWRGGFLADVPPSALISTEAERSMELRLAAAELRIGAEMSRGRHAEVIPELRFLVAEHPLREGLWLLLMRALDGAGRHAEALEAYGQARETIADELGVDPGPELQRLYARLLAADAFVPRPPTSPARLDGPAAGAPDRVISRPGPPADAVLGQEAADEGEGAPRDDVPGTIAVGALADVPGAVGPGGVPDAGGPDAPDAESGPHDAPLPQLAQLPADIGDFTGRDRQVRHLCDTLTRQDETKGPGAVRIAVVAGAAGLGKTTLAIHAAHQVRDMFPDGQLYVDLSGASADPAVPGEVLARFLRDLGVDGDKVPAGEGERAALYRTRLTGRRVLILLDNAKDAAQVRPLLPGSASCAVLATTRNRTPDLVGMRFFDLNVLSDPEALELFTRIVDDDRPAAEPDATAEILLACAGLPLAIRICAARLAARGQWRVATMANRLRDEQRRLDELQIGDLEVRASFQVSYDSLHVGRRRVDPARVFRLLGLWQGRKISLPAATALAGESEGGVAEALETLVDANLLESPAPDWYQFHDLLRVYATERAQAEEPETAREEAVARLLRWYLGTAEAAADSIAPGRYRLPRDASSLADEPFPAPEDVFTWYDEERANVIIATRQAAAVELDDIAWRLPTALFAIFNRRDNWTDGITAHRIAVDSARKTGNRLAEAWALQNLGQALAKIHENEALSRLEQSLAIRREIGDRDGEAQTVISLANTYYELRGAEAALEHSRQSLGVLRELGNPALLGAGLNNLGEYCRELGKLDEAAECYREALDIWKSIGGLYVQGHVLQNLGRVYLESGQAGDAVASLTEAHRLHLASGDLMGQARTLRYLGQAQYDSGRSDEAANSWTAALGIFENLKAEAEASAIRAMLAA